ncbi:helix-turn-helix domain-containing protein [Streptomyces uncialis]|uniref:helix-turn-helix domain-containing protein n=1 Tax=Streptomyces uncialis TaxID=1048205 RepID=UPI0022549FBF|nr:helix-turn-helix transcriptional regulator [Streptomyces uncialis]MCX4663489.1 helix-turn-helix transcriptional regulator [Streptomyces uncialis]
MSEPVGPLEWFGREVEAALHHKGANQRQLAEASGYKEPYVSKVKNGKQLPSTTFAAECDAYFDTGGWFVRLLQRVSQRGHPEWFIPYVALEERAAEVMDFSPYLVMGLLQTPSYAEALFRAAHPRDSDERVAERVEIRLARRALFDLDSPPHLWVVLDESCLRRMVGDHQVMHGQVSQLLRDSETTNVTVQVLPFDSGAPASAEPYTLLTFDEDDEAPVIYAETVGLGRVIDSSSVVRIGLQRFERLRADALSPKKSREWLRAMAKEYAG